MPGEGDTASKGVSAGSTLLPPTAPRQAGVPARFNYHPDQVVPLPTPKLPRAPVTWRTPAVQLPLVTNTRKANDSKVSPKQAKQPVAGALLPIHSAQPCSAQEEASGYMSTESDSDRPTQGKGKKKADASAQPIRDYKGQSRQMITMAFLEEGGYFDVPIQVASARLGLGVTTLKRVCRASNMKRWPFRKRNSLGRLIDRTKQVLDDGTGQDNMQKLAALQVLEKQRQVMRNCQGEDMDEKIKSYRQAIFKLDHAERKRGEVLPNPAVNKLTATSAVQRILPGSEEAMEEAGPSNSAGQ